MSIICATHFTESSSDALAVAAQLARRSGQPLWLTSVTSGIAFNPSNGAPRGEAAADRTLHVEADVLRRQGLMVEVALLHGSIDRALTRLVSDVGAGLLVVGETRHVTSTYRQRPAERIARTVHVPTLVVHQRRPFANWASGQRPLNVLLAIDHTWHPEVAHAWLRQLSTYGALDVVAVHVWSVEAERRRRGGGTEESLAAELERETSEALVALPDNVLARVRLEQEDTHVGRALARLAEVEHADLIALGTHGPKGLLARLRSVAHELLVNANTSVALVPDEYGDLLARHHPTAQNAPRRLRMFREL